MADSGPQSVRVVAEDETDAQPTAGLWRKRDGTGLSEAESPAATLSRGERPALAWTGFYCFSRALHQRRIYYLLHRILLSTF